MLPGCLTSVAGAVDQIVLVDTGSTDRTRDLAREAGALVASLPWTDDFAAPRNEALRHATGEWVLQLDCDERLAPGAARALRRAADQGGFDAGLLPLHHASRLDAAPGEVLSGRSRLGAPIHLPRLLRRTPDLAWRGRIHECVSDWAARRGNRLRGVPADLLHLGNVPGLRDGRAKRDRNLALLRRRCAEEPDDVTAFGYLAAELLAGGEREEAARVAEAGWALLRSQPAHRGVQRLATARALCAWVAGDDRRTLETAEGTERREALGADLRWLRGAALRRRLGPFQRLLYTKTDVGPPGLNWIIAVPELFLRLPRELQDRIARRATRPAGAGWLVPRLAGVPIHTGRSVLAARPQGERLRLRLDDGDARTVDHLLLCTGYRVDLARYAFLAPPLLAEVRRVDGAPLLRAGYETSVAGLHVLGAPAAYSFGPVMRFVSGTGYGARGLTRVVMARRGGRAAPRPVAARA